MGADVAGKDESRGLGRPRWRKWLRRLGLVVGGLVVLLVMLVVGYVVVVNWKGESARREMLAELRRRGLHTSISELKTGEQPVEDYIEQLEAHEVLELLGEEEGEESSAVAGTDGTPYWLAAFELARFPREWIKDIPYVGLADPPQLGEPVGADMAAKIQAAVRLKQDLFSLIEKARTFEKVNYDLDLLAPRFASADQLGWCRSVARSLQLLCLHEQASGNADKALGACEAIFDMIRTFDGEDALYVWLIRQAAGIMAFRGVEGVLSRTSPSATALQELRAKLLAESRALDLNAVVTCEIALMADDLRHIERHIARGQYELARFVASDDYYQHVAAQELFPDPEGHSIKALASQARWVRVWSVILPGAYKLPLAKQVEALVGTLDDTLLPFQEHAAKVSQVLASRAADEMAEAPLGRGFLWLISHVAAMRVGAAAAALECYRIERGAWPDALADAPGASLEDPFDGGELKYVTLPHGCMVYSIGMNQKDDGGEWDLARDEGQDDIAFRLFDVDWRGKEGTAPGKGD